MEKHPEQLAAHSSAVCLSLFAPPLVAPVRHPWVTSRLLPTHWDHELTSCCSPYLTEEGYTNLRSEWYNKGNDEGREEDLFWERESHEPLLIFQWKKSNVA